MFINNGTWIIDSLDELIIFVGIIFLAKPPPSNVVILPKEK